MDFLDPKKKRAHAIRLYVGYVLMGVALLIGTLILAFEAYGYDLDRRSGQVIQNGLIFVDAHPESANISLNGQSQGQTDARLVVPAGEYTLQLKRDGYRDWQKTFMLEGRSIERVVYPFLFPVNIAQKNIKQYDANVALATASPDRHWMVVQQPGQLNSFDNIDLSNDKNAVTSFALPAGLVTTTGPNHVYELVEWSNDNKHVVLKHTFDGGNEFIEMDRDQPAQSINVNKTCNVPISSLSLRDKDAGVMYVFDQPGKTVKRCEIKTKAVTPVVDGALSFKSYGTNQILYVTDSVTNPANATAYLKTDTQTFPIREVPKGNKYLLDQARFDGRTYTVVGSDTDTRTYIYKNAEDELKSSQNHTTQPYRSLLLANPQFVSFSANIQFIGVQNGDKFAVYDIEHGRQYRYDARLSLPAAYQAKWMDGDRFAVVANGKVVVLEFDGQNKQTLVSAQPNVLPAFDRDYNVLYTFNADSASPTKSVLQRGELKVKK